MVYKIKFLVFLILVSLSISCNKKSKALVISSSDELDKIISIKNPKRIKCSCNKADNYAPGSGSVLFDDIKYIRMNFHYPNSSDKKNNYTGENAVKYTKGVINHANERIEGNEKMQLPEGNTLLAYDPGYRYLLEKDPTTASSLAIYEDVDDENWAYIRKGKNANNYDRKIIKKFNKKNILNVYAMAYHPDSLKSKTFKAGRAGIALGTSLKIAGIMKYGLDSPWMVTSLMNHEIGHVFGLRHSWYKNDGCNDTPPNPNCWEQSDSGKCAGVISNNMMDYNNQQSAITPCQIGMIKKNMHKMDNKVRNLIVKDWCSFDPDKTLVISEDTNIDRAIDMKGNIVVKNGATLRLSCRTHMPENGKIIIHPEAKLILNACIIHNDCGTTWDGFEILTEGNNKGIIEYNGEVQILNLKNDPILPPSDQ